MLARPKDLEGARADSSLAGSSFRGGNEKREYDIRDPMSRPRVGASEESTESPSGAGVSWDCGSRGLSRTDMELDRLDRLGSGLTWGSAVRMPLSGTFPIREDGAKDASKSRTLVFDLALGSHDFVRSEIVLALPIFGRSSGLVTDGEVDPAAGEASAAPSRRKGLGAALPKERSSPESKEGISKERVGKSLESGSARE